MAATYYNTAQLARIYGLPKDRVYDAKKAGVLKPDIIFGVIDGFSPFRLREHLASLATRITAQEYVDAMESIRRRSLYFTVGDRAPIIEETNTNRSL